MLRAIIVKIKKRVAVLKKALWILIYSILGLLNPYYLLSHDFDDKFPMAYASFQSPARNAAYVAISTGEYRIRAHHSQLKGAGLRIKYERFTQEKWLTYLRYAFRSDQSFLENAEWYVYDNFVAVAQRSSEYASFVAKHYQKYKKYEHKNGWFDSKKKHRLAQRFAQLYKEIKIQEQAGAEKKRTQKFYDNYPRLNEFFIDELNVQHDHAFFFSSAQHERWERRNSAFQEMKTNGISYTSCEYHLSSSCGQQLRECSADSAMYQRCDGNPLQQVIHRDCVALAHETAHLPVSSPLYDHRSALIDWIDAAREFNQDGECAKACTIQDLCFSLLEYGTALVEGAVAGVMGAVEDLVEHSINAAACIIMPHGVLVYQLSKVLVNVADIGLTYVVDKEKARRKLDDYIAPLNSIIEAIHNKQVSGPDVVRGMTQCAVCWKAQSKLLGGLSKFYHTTKTKLDRFIRENPLAEPQEYLTTPEGMLLQSSNELVNKRTLLPKSGEKNSNLVSKENVADFIKFKRVPLDFETILHSPLFQKTKLPRIKGATIYKSRNRYYHRDTFHTGEAAHLEVYDLNGCHLGEANPMTGELIIGTSDSKKRLWL